MFTDLSGRFNYQQLTQPVSSASYLQESGLSLQIGQFQFRQVTPGAIVAGNYLDQWPLVLFGPRIYQVSPVNAVPDGPNNPSPDHDYIKRLEEIRLEEIQLSNNAIILALSSFI